MLAVPGYQILALIYESANSFVYRGRRERDDRPVVLKMLKQQPPPPAELHRYEAEYEIAHTLDIDSIVKAYDLQSVENTLVMVLEDFGGESLKLLMDSQKFTLLGFLKIAIKIAEGLGYLHAAHIIHKDINPSNIVYNPATGELKLIDFSIATVLNQETPALKNPSVLEGTLAYISPEQTGRMNRSLDYRTDFYSLGATLYELLLHRLPFDTSDPMELVHCHIAQQPTPPRDIDSDIPAAISDIVMKLMAKTAEDRYQSAWGLKADLEACLAQLQTHGKIVDFVLGSQDISDKFQIPQKLYGRDAEVETLLNAFDRTSDGKTEMMLVAGYSGIGKSVLVQEIYKPITQRQGYFISGKFDQFQRTIPYSAIVAAFSELVRLLLTETESNLQQWKDKILNAVGPNGQIIIDTIPEVELIIGPQPPVQELGPTEAQNRFNFVFQNFIQVFCAPEHPLVIFLDDLQWADSATLKLIELMMGDENTQYLFLIGAYRDNEVIPTHPLSIQLDTLRNAGVTIGQIELRPLGLDCVAQLIGDTLHRDSEQVRSLAELVVEKTDGNPFFVNEFLKTLYSENLLVFEPPQPDNPGGWQWDIDRIRSLAITDNVVDLMIDKLKKLPEATQQVLRLVACIGNQFDLNTLSLIHEKEASATFQDLLPAIQDGLILPISEADVSEEELINFPLLILNYKFLHDRVQQAAYALIDDSHKQAVHLKIGRLLLANTPEEYWSERIFDLVDHLNVARNLIADPDERIDLARLNLDAGKKAIDATAYVAAQQYLATGIDCLDESAWNTHYELYFSLHKQRALIEYLNGNFELSRDLTYLTLEKSKTALEQADVYNLLLIQNTLSAKYDDAVVAGRKALALLGVELPAENFAEAIGVQFGQAKENLGDRAIPSLINAPNLNDPEKQIALQLFNNLLPSAYFIDPQLWTLCILQPANLSLKYGHTAESAAFYANYGILLAAVFGDYRAAYEFGQVALQLSEKWNNLELKCKVSVVLGNALNYWFEPLARSEIINNEGYQAGLNAGDLQYAGYILMYKALNSFVQGKLLSEVVTEAANYVQFSQKTQNQMTTDTLHGLQLVLHNLTQKTKDGLNFDLAEISESDYSESCLQNQNFFSYCIYQILKLETLYLYGNLEAAKQCATEAAERISFITGIFPSTEFNFYQSLLWLALYDNAEDGEKAQLLETVRSNQETLKIWAENSPDNFEHKYCLVNAEISRIEGDIATAIELYDRAISTAAERSFIHHEALANERAAEFWFAANKPKYGRVHLREAYYSYQRWGATRKVRQLEDKYPQLLMKSKFDGRSRTIPIDSTHTTGGDAGVLDLASVMKASQAISGEIVLDKLLAKVMKILIENAGAQRGCLILPQQDKLEIAAEASIGTEEAIVQQSVPVEESNDLPKTVICYVDRTHTDVVLSNAAKTGQFTTDPYIRDRKLKSILCTPIVNQGKLVAILYLENNLTADAFTPDRLEILRLLSAQAAVSLENAILYASLEQKVAQRTQELNEKNLHLEDTLKELQRTQAQLIQTEKMSGLGQLVAGIAHEINNPIGFIYSNLSPAGDYVRDLLGLIELYQKYYPEPDEEIEFEIEDIDLEFLVEDLQKLLDSMQFGAERIRSIVLSLRTFSRLDEADMKPVNIHDGIDSTVMLLLPRLRGSGERATIDIVKEYAKLPKVTCYASQINQVFMNVLGNAIDALDSKRTDAEIPPQITIRTGMSDDGFVQIRIADNGPGMREETRHRLFDPFFTTKPVGSGTGLGLSVSYQIVVDSHHGRIDCTSTLGEGAEFIIEIPVQPPSKVS